MLKQCSPKALPCENWNLATIAISGDRRFITCKGIKQIHKYIGDNMVQGFSLPGKAIINMKTA